MWFLFILCGYMYTCTCTHVHVHYMCYAVCCFLCAVSSLSTWFFMYCTCNHKSVCIIHRLGKHSAFAPISTTTRDKPSVNTSTTTSSGNSYKNSGYRRYCTCTCIIIIYTLYNVHIHMYDVHVMYVYKWPAMQKDGYLFLIYMYKL